MYDTMQMSPSSWDMNMFYSMYPDSYKTLYPVIVEIIEMMDRDTRYMPSKYDINMMSKMVCDRVRNQFNYEQVNEEIAQRENFGRGFDRNFDRRGFGRERFFDGNLLGDFARALLLRELFRRRGIFFI